MHRPVFRLGIQLAESMTLSEPSSALVRLVVATVATSSASGNSVPYRTVAAAAVRLGSTNFPLKPSRERELLETVSTKAFDDG